MGRLIKALNLRYPAELAEISRGITALSTSPAASKTLDEIKALFQEYTESEEKERQEIEKSGREILHQLRISGTAVDKLNIRAKEEWQKKLKQISLPFDGN
jgi:pantothenate synthetase